MVTSLLHSRITSSITFSEMQCHSSDASKHRAILSHETKAQSLPIHDQVGVPSKSAAAGNFLPNRNEMQLVLARSMQTLLCGLITYFTQTIRQRMPTTSVYQACRVNRTPSLSSSMLKAPIYFF